MVEKHEKLNVMILRVVKDSIDGGLGCFMRRICNKSFPCQSFRFSYLYGVS